MGSQEGKAIDGRAVVLHGIDPGKSRKCLDPGNGGLGEKWMSLGCVCQGGQLANGLGVSEDEGAAKEGV